MSTDGQDKREQLKKEYKEHYRKIREAKERIARSRRSKNITDALKDMDTSRLTETFDEFLYGVKNKIARVEARLDVAMDSLSVNNSGTGKGEIAEEERDEELRKARAKETLRQAKMEMGMLYNEIEQQADSLEVNKTVGKNATSPPHEKENETEIEDSTEEPEQHNQK